MISPRAIEAPSGVIQGFLLPVHQHHICSIDAYTFAVNCTIPALTDPQREHIARRREICLANFWML
nr:hypothetical protein EC90111_0509 [Escherichia coli 9.0111]